MSVEHTSKKNLLPQMLRKAAALNGKKVEVGVFDGDYAWLAGIHEFGCRITSQDNNKYLTIPLTPIAAANKAKNFVGTFVYTSKKGNKFIAWEKGGKLELLYLLTKSVTIPERSFLRAGFDACHKEVINTFEKAVSDYLLSQQRPETILKQCGKQLASQIKKYARDLKEPKKQKITIASYGGVKKNPLIKTEAMINHITYRIEDD